MEFWAKNTQHFRKIGTYFSISSRDCLRFSKLSLFSLFICLFSWHTLALISLYVGFKLINLPVNSASGASLQDPIQTEGSVDSIPIYSPIHSLSIELLVHQGVFPLSFNPKTNFCRKQNGSRNLHILKKNGMVRSTFDDFPCVCYFIF